MPSPTTISNVSDISNPSRIITNMLTATSSTVDDVLTNTSPATSVSTANNCSHITSSVSGAQVTTLTNLDKSSDINQGDIVAPHSSICNVNSSIVTGDEFIETKTAASSILNGVVTKIVPHINTINQNLLDNCERITTQIDNQNKIANDLTLSTTSNVSLANILMSPVGSSGGFLSQHHGDNISSISGGDSNDLWPSSDDKHHTSVNGYNNFQNFPASSIFNSSNTIGGNLNHQHQRRAITSSQKNFSHNLSPNRSTQLLQNHQNDQQQQLPQNIYKNPYSTWSNSATTGASQSVAWLQAQTQQSNQSQNNLAQWTRGRSVPNLNPLSTGNCNSGMPPMKPISPNPGPKLQSQFLTPHTGISPLKYRRSTSFPGKGASAVRYSPEIPAIEDYSNPFTYQERSCLGNNIDMQTLENCLSDLMRNVGESNQQDHLKGKPYFQGIDDQISEETGVFVDRTNLALNSPARSSPHSQESEVTERYSRKVFVGGLPPDIDEDEITTSFRKFGPLVVDWPHKAESKSYFPPKGYAFLLFQDESSVQQLIEACITDEEKLYLCVSSPTIKDKPVQIRPWRLADADFVLDASMPLDPRKTVFVGGVPRPLKAVELAMIMDRLYGGVCYAGIDTDPELKYPKGAGRVAFANQQSYIAAISARFVQLQHGDIDKRVEVKPYVLDDQMCDECQGQRCGGKFAPFFCANVTCLQYYCEQCWGTIHSRPGREYHKPLVKEGADRPRAVPFRWC